ncbi:MAG: hypothetical protein HRT77_11630 [Halioglobus sp.]|nr:hypothetical protein [Halioglobus sp.]
MNYAEFLRGLRDETGFRHQLQATMRDAPFSAFRWETPPLTVATMEQPFACLFHHSPELQVPANGTEFAPNFLSERDVVSFKNLGGDALLIVPCPTSTSTNYSHIGAFHRSASDTQLHAFWTAVAHAALNRIGTEPVWLSTAGGGVDWLHMRLDDRPKYYRYSPWRN